MGRRNKQKQHARHIPNVTIILDKFTSQKKKHLINKVRTECQTSSYYHKFVVHKTETYEKDYIIKSIVDFVYPYPLIPVNFKQYKKTCRFVAKDCLEAMMKILEYKCDIPNPLDPIKPFGLTVMANCVLPEEIEVSQEVPEIDNSNNIQEIEENRFNYESNLSLNKFSGDVGSNNSRNIQSVMEQRFNQEAKMFNVNNFTGHGSNYSKNYSKNLQNFKKPRYIEEGRMSDEYNFSADIGNNYSNNVMEKRFNNESETLNVNKFSGNIGSNYAKNLQNVMEPRFNQGAQMSDVINSGGIGSSNSKNYQNVMEKRFNKEAEMLDVNKFRGNSSNYAKNAQNVMEPRFNQGAQMSDVINSGGIGSSNSKNYQNVMEKRFNKETEMLDVNSFSDNISSNYAKNTQQVRKSQFNQEGKMLDVNSGHIGSNLSKNIQNVVEKQFNKESKMLDLNKFSGATGKMIKNVMKKRFNDKDNDLNNFSGYINSNQSENIKKIMEKRFNKETKMLDLSNFIADIDLNQCFRIFNQKQFNYIINQAVYLNPHELNLKNNSIKDISCISLLKMSVKILDLSDNKIADIRVLSALIGFTNLKELILTGNPLCAKYDSCSYNYVVDIKRYCPKLEKLDGIDITTPQFRKNFLCTTEAYELAAQFVEYYFSIYDSSNRAALNKIYDPSAIFSVNAKVIPNQKNSETVNLIHYGLEKSYSVCGLIDIVKLFQEFPKTYHDPYPIVCDVTIYNDAHAQLVISGIFKEFDQMLSFNRSFYFKRYGQEFLITNEQLHVSNALDYQLGWSFIFPSDVRLTGTPLPYYYEQYTQLEEVLQKVTNMNLEYCQKYLVYCNYDLRKALTLFSELHINKGIPREAFVTKRESVNKTGTRICETLQKKIVEKHGSISLKTLWDTVNHERLESSNDPPIFTNPTIKRIYKDFTYSSNSHTSNNSVPSASLAKHFNIKNKRQSNLIPVPESSGSFVNPKPNQWPDSQKTNENISNKRQSETNLSKTPIPKRSKKYVSDKTAANKKSGASNKISLSGLNQNETDQKILQQFSARRDQNKKLALEKNSRHQATKNTKNTLGSSTAQKNLQENSNTSTYTIARNTQAPVQVTDPSQNDLELQKKQLATKITTAVSEPIPKNNLTNKHELEKNTQSTTTKKAVSEIDTSQIQENLRHELEKTTQSTTTKEQISQSDLNQTQENLGHEPEKTTQSATTGGISEDTLSQIQENLRKQKQKLIELKKQFDDAMKLKNSAATSEQTDDTSKQKLTDIRQKLQNNDISNQSSNLESESDNKLGSDIKSEITAPISYKRKRTGRYRRLLKAKKLALLKKSTNTSNNENTSTGNLIITDLSSVQKSNTNVIKTNKNLRVSLQRMSL